MQLHYFVETSAVDADARHRAVALLTVRFPELEVDRCFRGRLDGDPDLWLCRTPNEDHIRRWLRAARLEAITLRRVDRQPDG